MGKPTAQAQTVIDKLLASGLARSEFSVRTDRIYVGTHPDTGKQCYEYGDVLIILKCNSERQNEMAKSIALQGLRVEFYKYESGRLSPYIHVCYGWDFKPGLYLVDASRQDRYGFSVVEEIL